MRTIAAIVGAALLGANVVAQDYVGDTSCSGCHRDMPETGFFDGYMRSGHPWKIFRTEGEVPDEEAWPWTPVPPLPVVEGTELVWADVEYVIGNYFWKARYIDREGYIYTGLEDEKTQWNLGTMEFVPYNAGEIDKPFNCGRCHTTGYDPDGSMHGLPGLVGTWAQDGIRCEACHGPSSEHVSTGGAVPPPGGKACSECHYRDDAFRMPWKGGFMRHHQQSEDLSHSAHTFLDCTSCHNPHRSVVWDDGGTTQYCSGCHEGDVDNGFFRVLGMESVACRDCHMPYMTKSGQKYNDYRADVRGHLFRIMTDPVWAADNTYEEDGSLFWNQDNEGRSYVTLDYACLGCHTDFDDLTIEEAADYADDIHTMFAANPGDLDRDRVVDTMDFLIVLKNWGTCAQPPPAECEGDANFDGVVDFHDISLVFELWD
jgi:hypothetical protein